MFKLLGACVLPVMFAGLSYAQSTSKAILVDVPFPFFVGNAAMSPGEYVVRAADSVVWWASMDLTERLSWNQTAPQAVSLANSHSRSTRDPQIVAVVFTKYSPDRYFVTDIWWRHTSDGSRLVKSRTERELITSRLITQSRPETVIVVARRAD